MTAGLRWFVRGGLFSLLAADASANGRYPAAKHIVFDPNHSDHFVATTTFGLLESSDGGKTFDWRCEGALGVAGDQDELVAISANGTTVAALTNGLVTTADGCSFRSAPELAGKYMADLALSRSLPHQLYAFHTDISLSGELDSQIVRSIDDGQTWTDVGPQLPITQLPLTIDVAPSDAMRVYVSARLGQPDAYASVLLRSDDGGKTFQTTTIPGTTDQRLAYIAAVHPLDANRVFFRVEDSPGTVLYSTEDGGQHFEKRFTAMGPLLGFAMSPDGSQIAFGGPNDGIWVGAENAVTFEQKSKVGPSCLTWTAQGIYACADQASDPFSIGVSHDLGATFEPLLRFDALCGVTACPSGTQGATECTAPAWDSVAPALGATCHSDAGAPPDDASSEPDAAVVPDATLDAPRSSMPDAHATDGSLPPPPIPPAPNGGCHCKLGRSGGQTQRAWGLLAFLGLATWIRWKRRQ